MKKMTKILSFMFAMLCISLCFVGCSFDNDNKEIVSIGLKNTLKTNYCINETLDLSNNKLVLTYSDDSQKELVINDEWITTPFDSTSVGSKQMVITYKEKQYTLNYIIENAILLGGSKINLGEYYTSKLEIYNSQTEQKSTTQYSQNTTIEDASYGFALLTLNADKSVLITTKGSSASGILTQNQDGTITIIGLPQTPSVLVVTPNIMTMTSVNGNETTTYTLTRKV